MVKKLNKEKNTSAIGFDETQVWKDSLDLTHYDTLFTFQLENYFYWEKINII